MSNVQLQVVFDRQDRTYEFNEEVTGKVVLDTQSSLTCRKLWVDFGWRTHGMGDKDKGGEKTLVLSPKELQLQTGEHREYPFRFRAPDGPASYHGHILNVDWYVTAHLDIPLRLTTKAKQDFLLIPGETPEKSGRGNNWMQMDEIPGRSGGIAVKAAALPDIQPGNPPKVPLLVQIIVGFGWVIVFGGFILPFMNSLPFPGINCFAIIIFFGVPIMASITYANVVPAILNTSWKQSIEIRDFQVTPSRLWIGDQVTCRIQLQSKRTFYLDNITAALIAEEVTLREGGSDSVTDTHVAYKQSFVKTYAENFMAGRLIFFDCDLPVLPGAPASFDTGHNSIYWSVKIKISSSSHPSWEKTTHITVLPSCSG